MRSPIIPFHLAVGLLAMGGVGFGLPAQQVRVIAPIGGVVPQQNPDDDHGVAVEMFENPNLDRYLRKAQAFLERQDYVSTIQVLQDVIEGHTVEFVDSAPAKPGEDPVGPQPSAKPDAKPEAEKRDATGRSDGKPGGKPDESPTQGTRRKSTAELDAAQSVFSQDGRVYRPVRRLCHEILATLPPVGIELYRAAYEVAASEMLEAAQRDGSISSLEQIANRYFITLPAGRAMIVLADRLMHEGRHRAAVQVLRDLVEVYPKENRQRLGISEVWCRFKIALCLRLAGEVATAHTAVLDLASKFPEESLRIVGELQAVKDLPQSAVFASEVLAMVTAVQRDRGLSWLAQDTEALVPLWQYRFRNPEPYREPKATNNEQQIFFGDGQQTTAMPHANRHGPASWLAFSPEATTGAVRALFFEHYRLRVADALSGLQLVEGDGLGEPPSPRDNYPRVRIAASDYALLRPVEDEARRYAVLGYSRSMSQSEEVLKASELVAYQRDGLERTWSSAQWLDGDEGLRDVTFLAAPTVFGERLLLPALRRSAYTLECLERTTGRPLWHTPLHAGGSPYFKAPGAPVSVQGGIAFVITNAGCLAAVDAFAGDLRWIRRYERSDPLRPRPVAKGRSQDGMGRSGTQFVQNELAGFLPNDLLVRDGLVIMAPCDGNMLLCVDGATGQPVWMLDATTRYAPYGPLRMLVGANATDLFALSEKQIVCIGLRGGLVRWSRELPVWNGSKNAGRGRGTVVGDEVVVPGERELLVFDAADKRPMRRIPLAAFGESRDPLAGPFNVISSGPWLAVGYQGGVEMFSSSPALSRLAQTTEDPLQKANFLVHAGLLSEAEGTLRAALTDPATSVESRTKAASRLLALVRDRALQAARRHEPKAVDLLDIVLPFAGDRTVRLNWHLARLEVCQEGGDLRGHEQEQQRLYDFMEGKG